MTNSMPGGVQRSAAISADGLYRYELSRTWDDGPRMVFVMLNPSTADGNQDDPTIRRVKGFAKREGCGGIDVLNLYALRATKPSHLLHVPDPEGPLNEVWWKNVLGKDNIGHVVAAWGANAHMGGLPSSKAFWRVRPTGYECLGITKAGAPRHPLYIRGDQPLEPFTGRSNA